MPVFRHLFLFSSYFALSLAIALSLPYSTMAISLEASYGLGALVFLMGAALHEGVARRWTDDQLLGQLHALAHTGQIRERDVADLGRQIANLREMVGSLSDHGDDPDAAVDLRSSINPAVLTLSKEIATAGDLAGRVLRAAPLPEFGAGPSKPAEPLRADPEFAHSASAHRHDLADPDDEISDIEVIALVRESVAEDRIHVVTQPIVSLPQRKLCFREQFTRLRLPNGEALEAGRYVHLAEKEGLITSIDNFQLFRAAQIARDSLRRRRREVVFVNLSRHTMKDKGFVTRFIEFLSANEELAGRITFEFSASDLDLVTGALKSPLDYLAKRGFRYSLDGIEDIGDLNPRRLSARNFRFIKVPADLFLRQADPDIGSVDFSDFRAQLDSAGIDLIVSHIETEQTLLRVLDHRVDYGQGHLFGAPA